MGELDIDPCKLMLTIERQLAQLSVQEEEAKCIAGVSATRVDTSPTAGTEGARERVQAAVGSGAAVTCAGKGASRDAPHNVPPTIVERLGLFTNLPCPSVFEIVDVDEDFPP